MKQINELIKQILHAPISQKLVERLITTPAIRSALEKHWDLTPDTNIDLVEGEKIWKTIHSGINHCVRDKYYTFYKRFSIVASILLLISLGTGIYLLTADHPKETAYVVATGLQRIEMFILPDGTKVKVGPGSKLSYPDRFDGERRLVNLEGQAFFEVAYDKNKPFVVSTCDMEVTALGTAFELFNYPGNDEIETILLNGKVKIVTGSESNDTRSEQILTPNKKFVYLRSKKTAQILEVDADRYTQWRNKKNPSFNNEQLSVIIPRLEQWFGVQIECPAEIAFQYRYTFTVRDESVENILSLLRFTSPVSFIRKDDVYILRSQK